MSKLLDHFDSVVEFEELLAEADEQAVTTWQEDFVSDMKDRYEQYGTEMYLSDPQKDVLERIANPQHGDD